MNSWVTIIALGLSVASFALYIVEAMAALRAKPITDAKAVAALAVKAVQAQAAPSAGDIAKLAEALSKLVDSLAKAGPALTAIIAALLFLLIAAVSSGGLSAGDKQNASPPTAQHEPK